MSSSYPVKVKWTLLRDRSSLWHEAFCLYAYSHPHNNRLLYIGKADFRTVRQRLDDRDKDALFQYLNDEYGLDEVAVLHGAIVLDGGRRTSALLSDVESLLINRLRPVGNIMCTQRRGICRPGLHVVCEGDWPHRRAGFRDDG
jgi:hypothetical protein